jgi:hypothetical protein
MHCCAGSLKLLHFSRLSNLIGGVGGFYTGGGGGSRSKLAFTQNVFDEGKRGCLAASAEAKGGGQTGRPFLIARPSSL